MPRAHNKYYGILLEEFSIPLSRVRIKNNHTCLDENTWGREKGIFDDVAERSMEKIIPFVCQLECFLGF